MTALEIARLEIHAPAGWKATLRRAASRTGRQRSQCLSWVIFVTPGHCRGSKTFFRRCTNHSEIVAGFGHHQGGQRAVMQAAPECHCFLEV